MDSVRVCYKIVFLLQRLARFHCVFPGGVKVSFDVGTGGRDEVNTNIQNIDLANLQPHVVVVQRYNSGR